MATDSSSGTLPSSRRLTMDSSSSMARSKLSVLTSGWVFSAILTFPAAPRWRQTRGLVLPAHCGGNSGAHQRRDVRRDGVLQSLQVIAAFEYRDDPPACGFAGEIHQLARHPAEIFRVEIDVGERIAAMRVETCGDDDQLGSKFRQLRQDQIVESGAESGAAVVRRQRRVDDVVVL